MSCQKYYSMPDFVVCCYMLSRMLEIAEVDKQERIKIQDMFYADQFSQGETSVRQLLKGNPNDLDLMKFLDQALHGQGKFDEANRLASQIQYHWRRHHRSEWIAQGHSAVEAVFSRMILNSQQHYRVYAKQYCEPGQLGGADTKALYKFVAVPKKENSIQNRLFRLDTTVTGAVLWEHFQGGEEKEIVTYETLVPDIQNVAQDVVSCLDDEDPKTAHAQLYELAVVEIV